MLVKQDLRHLLYESLKELSCTFNINEITVQQIASNCGVSRSSFYRLFKDKYDLMVWGYLEEAERIKMKYPNVSSYREIIHEIIIAIKANLRYYREISRVSVFNSLQEFIRNYAETYIIEQMKQLFANRELPSEYLYIAQSSSTSFAYLINKWVNNNCDIPVSQFSRLISDSIPHNVYLLLNQDSGSC